MEPRQSRTLQLREGPLWFLPERRKELTHALHQERFLHNTQQARLQPEKKRSVAVLEKEGIGPHQMWFAY